MYFDIRKDTLYCDESTSNLRRSTRTVLDIIFYRLTTWLAPILTFTTEEVWLERFGNIKTSIHMEDIPITPKDWYNQELATKWIMSDAKPVERPHKDKIAISPHSPEAFEELIWRAFFPFLRDPDLPSVITDQHQNDEFEILFHNKPVEELQLEDCVNNNDIDLNVNP